MYERARYQVGLQRREQPRIQSHRISLFKIEIEIQVAQGLEADRPDPGRSPSVDSQSNEIDKEIRLCELYKAC